MKVEANKTYIGVVEDNNDPLKLGRARVRVLDVFDNIEVSAIPWASSWKDLNGNEFNVPEKGKVLLVVFDSGDEHKPEFISADHYNVNLEKKLTSLSATDYVSMKSLIFDHKTQIYVNDKEGLKIDHKYNNINITQNTIDLNLKDNNRHVNIGDATAGQQAILGNHWMDWFDEFVDNLMGDKGGPYLGNLGAPVVTNPAMIEVLMKYKALRDPVFLSHHVNIVDNNKVSTVKNTHREDNSQVGDAWSSTKKDNDLTSKTNENFKPVDGPKPEYDDKHVEPSITPSSTITAVGAANGATSSVTNGVTNGATSSVTNGVVNSVNTNPPAPPLSSTTSNPKIDKLISFLKSKDYRTYDQIGVLNIVAFQSPKKDNGSVSNKFDDTLNVFYKNQNGNWELLEYQITTMPGYFPNTEMLPQVALLALGQYADMCRIDTYTVHHDFEISNGPLKKDKCLRADKVKVHINDSTKIYNYKSETMDMDLYVLVHKSSDTSAENVYNYSNGAQVFKIASQWDQFIALCESQVTIAKKDTFTYTFCKQSEFDTFVPTTPETVSTPAVVTTPATTSTTNIPTTTVIPTTTEPAITGFDHVDIIGIYDNNVDKTLSFTLKNVNIEKYNSKTGFNERTLTDDEFKKFLDKELKIVLEPSVESTGSRWEEVIKWGGDGSKYPWSIFGMGYSLGSKKWSGTFVLELPYHGTYGLSVYYGGTKIQTVSVEINNERFQKFY